jgi:tetratricopeptide (TPR) repeat protein
MISETYGIKDVSRLFDISESRLRYWDRSAFLSPTGYEGRRRVYTFQDLISVRSAKTLLDSGLSLQRARRILCSLQDKLPQTTAPLSKLRIISDSKTVLVIDEDGHFEAQSGQLLLDFNVSSLEKEVIAELPQGHHSRERSAYEWYLEGCRLDEDESTLADAESAYYKAIHLDPSLSNAYTNLGNLLYRTGAADDARALYEKAIEIDPNQPEAHYNLGFLLFEKGDLQQARDHFDQAVSLDSTFADAHFNLAMAELRLGGSDKAKTHLRDYLTIDPSGPWADLARARLAALCE